VALLKVEEPDTLFVIEATVGVTLTPYDPGLDEQIAAVIQLLPGGVGSAGIVYRLMCPVALATPETWWPVLQYRRVSASENTTASCQVVFSGSSFATSATPK
jgi:hypothetical protein